MFHLILDFCFSHTPELTGAQVMLSGDLPYGSDEYRIANGGQNWTLKFLGAKKDDDKRHQNN